MAIRIPILTSFDPKGLRQANAAFAKLQTSIGSLGTNFAIAGVAIGAAGAFLGKAVNSASNLEESVNAVNVAFGTSASEILKLGENAATSLGLSKTEFNEAAVAFSSFAERIVGKGGDTSKFIQELTTRAADFASVYNLKGGVAEALERFRSGLAGQTEPLAKFGVNLLDSEVKAYAVKAGIAAVGTELTATQKVQARFGLLMQETSKTAGDFANTSDGLANGMRILQKQIADTEAEIGEQLLPVLAELLPIVRDLVKDLGTQLVDAVKAVDWKALATDVMNFTKFLVENATTIANVVVGIFALNTAYKVMAVGIGIVNVALELKKWYLAQTAAGMTTAAIASGALSSALRLIPFVAVASAAAYLAFEIANSGAKFDAYKKALQGIDSTASEAETNLGAFSLTVTDIGAKVSPQIKIIDMLVKALSRIPKNVTSTVTTKFVTTGRPVSTGFNSQDFNRWKAGLGAPKEDKPDPRDLDFDGGGTKKKTFAQQIKEQARLAKLENRLRKQGLSEGLASSIISSGGPAEAKKTLEKISNTAGKYAKNIQKMYNKTKAGQAELKNSSEEVNAAVSGGGGGGGGGRGRAAEAETNVLDERAKAFESFAEAVKNTFAEIRDSILNAFELPKLGSSITGIIRNMGKLLTTTRGFADNIKKLSAMGLNAELLQQIIAQGPMAGAKLAASLVAGGAASLGQINEAYSEFGNLASDIATSGTNSLFGTQAQQNIYNIEVNGGVGSGPTIGQAIVDAIRAYERTSGAVWQRA